MRRATARSSRYPENRTVPIIHRVLYCYCTRVLLHVCIVLFVTVCLRTKYARDVQKIPDWQAISKMRHFREKY